MVDEIKFKEPIRYDVFLIVIPDHDGPITILKKPSLLFASSSSCCTSNNQTIKANTSKNTIIFKSFFICYSVDLLKDHEYEDTNQAFFHKKISKILKLLKEFKVRGRFPLVLCSKII